MKSSPSWKANSRSADEQIPRLYKSEGLLPCPQEPSTGSCIEPDESTSHLHTLFI
jgi:hypothetical protein